jgi:periplasmic protein TonB
MANPIAHEVRVIATGARPGEGAGKRELFTEETSTVLVFENAAVIRLQAAVVQGQLLFLTNQESKREVVAQVTRMRVFRPTNCYVELEFTEPSPGFWGIDFPDAPELVPVTTQQSEAAELVQSAEVIAEDATHVPATPSVDAVDALKNEVEALREQLKLLQTQAAERPSVAMSLPRASAGPAAPSVPRAGESSAAILQAAATTLPASASEEETAVAREEASYAEEELLPKPAFDSSQGEAAAKRSAKSGSEIAPRGPSHVLRAGLLVAALLLLAVGGAWYEHWIPGMDQRSGLAANSSSQPVRPASPVPAAASAIPNASNPRGDAKNAAPSSNGSAAQANPGSESTTSTASASEKSSASDVATSQPPAPGDEAAQKPAEKSGIRERLAAVMSLAKHSTSRSTNNASPTPIATSAVAPAEDSAIVPAKLIKSVRPNPPAEALQGYISGNVNIDAVVDATGHVKSMNILSGPATLRNAATEALKQYRYEPATQKGKPVLSHVNVTIQFWYEP